MPNMLRDAQVKLEATLRTHAGEDITYRRGGQSVALRAQLGRTEFVVDNDSGVGVQVQVTDFLFAPSLLVLGGQQALPRPGDRIDWPQPDGKTATFEVRTDVGNDCYRLDPLRTVLRVHTKRLSTSP